jgi:hypothetical protein
MIKAGVKLITAKESLDIAVEAQEQLSIERFANVMERIKTHAEAGSTSISYGYTLYPEIITALTELGYTVGEFKVVIGGGRPCRVISWES